MYYTKGFNSNYKEFVGYETCDKLIFPSGKGFRNTNTISKQVIPRMIIRSNELKNMVQIK